MSIDETTQKVGNRSALAASTGEQMGCPTSYDMADFQFFIPEEMLKIPMTAGPLSRNPTSPGKQARTGSGFRLL